LPSCSLNPPDNRANPVFGGIRTISADAQSFYNSLQVSGGRTLGQSLSIQASYTFSKSIDDASSHFSESGSASQFGFLRTSDRAVSDFDIRHRLTTNYFYTPPFGSGRRWWSSGIAAILFGGWRIGGILSLRTGVSFTPEARVGRAGYLFTAGRPNLQAGMSKNPTEGVSAGCGDIPAGRKLSAPDLYFDPCAYSVPAAGTIGNAGRNTIVAPLVFNTDLSLQRDFSLDSRRRLQFRAEFFNFPNHTSFNRTQGGSGIIFTGSSGRRNPLAGRITTTATTARQVQFALRLSF
jgi:hypothetical protein